MRKRNQKKGHSTRRQSDWQKLLAALISVSILIAPFTVDVRVSKQPNQTAVTM
jgi:hypothetical protein